MAEKYNIVITAEEGSYTPRRIYLNGEELQVRSEDLRLDDFYQKLQKNLGDFVKRKGLPSLINPQRIKRLEITLSDEETK